MYMRNLKHIVNRAIDARIIGDYPFGDPKKGKYKIPDGKNKKKALTLKDIEKLFSYTPTDKKRVPGFELLDFELFVKWDEYG